MPISYANGALLLLQCCLYFAVMAALLRFRAKVGIGVLTAALGTLHFLESYLASVFYVLTPVGVVSPGSSVLFSGKLIMLLLIYIKEDAAVVRQPIYGILAGNLLTLMLAFALRFHEVFLFTADAKPQTAFIETVGILMVWGTILLFIDAVALILLYERLGRRFAKRLPLRLFLALSAILAFDQAGFYLALRYVAGVPIEAFYAGLYAKLTAAAVFAALGALYLAFVEREELKVGRPLGDIFQALTYRERFNALAEHMARDRTTMLPNASSFSGALEEAFHDGERREPATLLLIEVDDALFADVHARLGRSNGEALLRTVARCIELSMHDRDDVFRIGERQFALICRCPPKLVKPVLAKLRRNLAERESGYGAALPVRVGGSGALPSMSARDVFEAAEQELRDAREVGPDAVRIGDPTEAEPAPISFAAATPRAI
jgi:diguanylate cyclase (GGDEF)-like protein